MKKLTLFMILLQMPAAYAVTGYSVCTYNKQAVDSVVCYGPTVMNDTTVRGDIKVTGSLKAKNISAQNVIVEGSAEISDAKIMGSVNIVGSLTAMNVEFLKGVAVESDAVLLNHTVVNGLVTITSSQKSPVLQVQCSSALNSAVLFSGKAGVVQITGDAYLKGKVANGAVQFVKVNCN